jgi:hypothetical protein
LRKILIFILTYLLASPAVYTQEIKVPETSYNYFHDIQLGVTLAFTEIGPIPLAELSTSHGICFTERFSAGIGVSTIYFMTITPYVVGRVNLKAKDRLSKNTPYLSLKAGYMVYLIKGDSDYNSLNLEPRFGFSHLRKNGKSSWSYFLSANAFQGRVFPKIGVGFEF